jgi:hypothetical protein
MYAVNLSGQPWLPGTGCAAFLGGEGTVVLSGQLGGAGGFGSPDQNPLERPASSHCG